MKASDPLPLRIITHNIRYATGSPFQGEELWDVRKTGLINELRFHTLYNWESFICLQEVLHSQLVDIQSGLNEASESSPSKDEWTYIGVGRDDGEQAGEYSPIFYRPAIWECLLFRTIWLSKTPEKPSKSWDAASIRILTVGLFKHRVSKKRVVALNTHLDDQGSVSRYEATKMILDAAKNLQSSSGASYIFLAGDLNSEPHQEAYQLLNDPSSPFADLKIVTPWQIQGGHQMTFTGFGYENEPSKRIDFIHINNTSSESSADGELATTPKPWIVNGYAVLENRFDDGIYISDHRAVVGDLLLT
jgi:endonuclease/exonuclease/phosphatase family metal-dependent hydrolase